MAVNLAPEIRPVATIDEYHAVEMLQKEVWGIPDMDVVPMYHLVAAKESGGVILGAYDRDEMVGFVYGFPGFERSRPVHHSHMLAVREAYRSQGLGYRLKCEQRNFVLEQGIDVVTWTFDPLQSRNAFFNFRKLGVVADRYFVDLYGSNAASFLHRNGTDRLWVSWHIAHEHVAKRLSEQAPDAAVNDHPALVLVGDTGAPDVQGPGSITTSERLLIEIPSDMNAIVSADPELALAWRMATREAFVAAIEAGFLVEDFIVRKRSGRSMGAYLLSRNGDLRLW